MVSNPFRANRLRQLFLFSLLTGLLSYSVAPAVEARAGNPLLILAPLCGLGMMPPYHEQDADNEIKTELEDETGREATNPD